jgi:hypothetical protein
MEGVYRIVPVHQSYGWINKKFVNKEIVVLDNPGFRPLLRPLARLSFTRRTSGNIIAEGTVSPIRDWFSGAGHALSG